ncbi:hypothetical protein ACFYY2_30985 [Streptomyces sp. NPDC001822]|uniref:hypothetical protein n=1 Tax=Streptomyces sp. NPDC001822 TaxID=3364614 RepID=UPI003674C894
MPVETPAPAAAELPRMTPRMPLREIRDTASRVDFDRDAGESADTWSAFGRHGALCVGHRAEGLRAAAHPLGLPFVHSTV